MRNTNTCVTGRSQENEWCIYSRRWHTTLLLKIIPVSHTILMDFLLVYCMPVESRCRNTH